MGGYEDCLRLSLLRGCRPTGEKSHAEGWINWLTSKAGSAREPRASRALGARRIATQKDIMKQK